MEAAQQILAALGAVSVLGAAAVYIVKFIKFCKAPNDKQNGRLDTMEKRLDKHDTLLDNDKKRLDKLKEGNRVQMRVLMAMAAHMLDGNHTQQLRDAAQQMNEFLLNN